MDHLQEKFQITLPPKKTEDDNGENWASPYSARTTGEAGYMHRNNMMTDGLQPYGPKFNQLPPGMEIDNQMRTRVASNMPLSAAGESDVSKDANPQAYIKGYTRREMQATDDQYTGEHVDHFYGEAVDENGLVGFAERNNYLDRE